MSYKQISNQCNKMLAKLLIFCLATVIVSGCSTKKYDLSEQNKVNIPDFSINKNVVIVNPPSYYGNEQGISTAVGGAIGGAVGAVAGSLIIKNEDEPSKIKNYLSNQKIDIGTVVSSEFERQLLETPRFSGKLKEGAKTQFQLEVKRYGLIVKPYSFEYKPSLGINAKLIDESGTVIWEDSEFISGLNGNTPSYIYDDYFKSPEAFKTAFTIAAKEVVRLLIEEMD